MFGISQITNKFLKDIATIADTNNDAVINGEKEISIFLEKSKAIKENGLCSEEEYDTLLKSCPREVQVGNAKMTVGGNTTPVDEAAQEQYKNELEELVNKTLEKKQLENTPENRLKAIEIIKTQKELNIQIKIQEAKIEKLKQKKPEDLFETRKQVGTYTGMTGGALGGVALGVKIGLLGGAVGAGIGAFIGGIVGAIAGGGAGIAIATSTISDEEKANAQKQIDEQVKSATEELNKLKENYEQI